MAQSLSQSLPAPVAARPSTSADHAPAPDAREMVVNICRYQYVHYEGTRAQLTVEGLVPADAEWPQGTRQVRWQIGPWAYWLRRIRPLDLKGPMHLWTEGDWWALRVDPAEMRADDPSPFIRRRLDALADALHRDSRVGFEAASATFEACMKARNDKPFMAFKALIPALAPRRGRRSSNTKGALNV